MGDPMMAPDQKGSQGARIGAGDGGMLGQIAQREQGRARNSPPLANLAGAIDEPWWEALGECARYVKIGATGRNALDFHLAFSLGELVLEDPGGAFRIVSKDSGFDSLIAHLQVRGLDVERWHELPGSPPVAIGVTAALI